MIHLPSPLSKAKRPEDRLTVKLLSAVNTLFARGYHRLEVLTPCRIPRHGPAILICNHTNSLDPLLLQACCHQRMITWMMAKEYMDLPGVGWVFRTIGVIPVERSGRDTAPLRAALRDLKDGRVLGIFPEGKIAPTREFLPFQTGVALMAVRSGAPVYPTYLDGTQRGRSMIRACLQANNAAAAFGGPLYFGDRDTSKASLDAITQELVTAMEKLRHIVETRPRR